MTSPLLRGLVALAALLSTALLLVCADPALETTAYRAIMFDRKLSAREEGSYGTRGVLLRGKVSLFSTSDPAGLHKGRTTYVPCDQHLTKASLHQLIDTPVKGLLVEICEADTNNEQMLSLFFASAAVSFPVYFIPAGGDGARLRELLQAHASGKTAESVVLSAGTSLKLAQPYTNHSVEGTGILSQLYYLPKEFRASSEAPQVMISAQYDSLGVAPTSKTSGGVSGAVASLELWRRLTTASANAVSDEAEQAAGPYAVTSLLGSTGRLNFLSTAQWLAERKDSELDRYRLVLCLDELLPVASPTATTTGEDGEESTFYMHVQDSFMKRSDGKQLAELAETTAAAVGISLKVQAAKINYQHYDLRFEHEVFANRQVPAVTFSTHRTHHVDQIFRDVREPLTAHEAEVLMKRIDFLYSFIRVLLNRPVESAPQAWPGSASYVSGQMEFAINATRSPLAAHGAPLKQYAAALEQSLRLQNSATRSASATATTVMASARLKVSTVTFYGPYEEVIRFFVARSIVVELLTSAAIVVALAVFAYAEFGCLGAKQLLFPE